MLCEGTSHPIHYLDDYFFCGPPDSGICQAALGKAIPICHQFGLPVAPEGPSTTLTFLGIEIDSVTQELRLPEVKLHRLKALLAVWMGCRSATKHELQCVIGHLSHAAEVVKPGRTFMKELIRTMTTSYHLTRINTNAGRTSPGGPLSCPLGTGYQCFQACNWGIQSQPTPLTRGVVELYGLPPRTGSN